MRIQSLKLAYFSPTGTTASVVRAMARGLDYAVVEEVDITLPEARQEPLQAAADDLLVVATPVYGGRIPMLMEPWLRSLRLNRTPVACVVMFGNRAFEDALIELTDLVRVQGGVVVGGAAFIGEHSFSNEAYPVAVARPDAEDLDLAETFGRKVREILDGLASVDEAAEPAIPGDRPYKERKKGGPVDFIAVGDSCVRCGTCAEHCPVGAISADDYTKTDAEKCIKCCACIKVCPENARTTKPGSPIEGFAKWLNENCGERKEPVYFF